MKYLNSKGYTFIELLGVIIIIVIVITPILGFLNNLLDSSMEGHTLSQMTVVGSSIIDRAKCDVKQDALDGIDIFLRDTNDGYINESDYKRYNIPDEFYASLSISQVIDLNLVEIEVVIFSDNLPEEKGLKFKTMVNYDE